jgi:hypothetical protein
VVARADRDRAGALARSLARLDVVRFAAETATSEHGLATPRYELAVAIEPEEEEDVTHRIAIGAATDGGAFARLDDDPVVVVLAAELVSMLEGTLVDRGLFATPLREVESVSFAAGGAERVVRWDGQRFTEGDEPLEESLSDRLASAIEGLRATSVGPYAPAAVADGLTPPRARITVTRGEGAEPRELVLLLGAPTGTDATIHARRADLAVGATVPESAVAVLLELAGVR